MSVNVHDTIPMRTSRPAVVQDETVACGVSVYNVKITMKADDIATVMTNELDKAVVAVLEADVVAALLLIFRSQPR